MQEIQRDWVAVQVDLGNPATFAAAGAPRGTVTASPGAAPNLRVHLPGDIVEPSVVQDAVQALGARRSDCADKRVRCLIDFIVDEGKPRASDPAPGPSGMSSASPTTQVNDPDTFGILIGVAASKIRGPEARKVLAASNGLTSSRCTVTWIRSAMVEVLMARWASELAGACDCRSPIGPFCEAVGQAGSTAVSTTPQGP